MGIVCLEIHNTTKGLLSLRKRGMHTICVDYYLQQLPPSNFRFDLWFLPIIFYLAIFFHFFFLLFPFWPFPLVLITSFYYCLQGKQLINNIRQYQVPLQKYQAMMELQASFFNSSYIVLLHSMRLFLIKFVFFMMLLRLSLVCDGWKWHIINCKYFILILFLSPIISSFLLLLWFLELKNRT